MNAFEALRKELDSRTLASGVLLISQKDVREIVDTYDRLRYIVGAAVQEFDREIIRPAEPSQPAVDRPCPPA